MSGMVANKKIYEYMATNGSLPVGFFIGGFDEKIRKKIFKQIGILQNSKNLIKEPCIKAFKTEKYKSFYEFRIKMKKVIRIIFYIDKESDIVLLHAFTKKHERATEKALETSIFRVNALKTCVSDKILFERGK